MGIAGDPEGGRVSARTHIKRVLFRPNGYPHSERMWGCSGLGLAAVGNTPCHAYIVWQGLCQVVGSAKRAAFFDTSFMCLADVR